MKKTVLITVAILVIFIIGFSLRKVLAPTVVPENSAPGDNNPVACTMEAKLCPDGSSVGRSGPNCEFDVCPEVVAKIPEEVALPASTIKIYFGNTDFNPNGIECGKVYPLDKIVLKSSGLEAASLEELFKGPSAVEKEMGYSSFFSNKTKDILKSIKIENEVAYVNLTDVRQIIPNASASCGSADFLGEIQTTLKEFPNIKSIVFAIEGKPATFYEWLQIGCPSDNQPGNICDETPFK